MTIVTVFLSKAMLCIASTCYPALVGASTPVGSYPLTHMQTPLPGYGGDVLVYAESRTGALALHRVYLRNPVQRRGWRLAEGTALDRRITDGCINVAPDVYAAVLASGATRLEVQP